MTVQNKSQKLCTVRGPEGLVEGVMSVLAGQTVEPNWVKNKLICTLGGKHKL